MNAESAQARRRLETAACAVIALLAAWFYFGTASDPNGTWFARESQGYYGLQTVGFQQGHLYAAIAPHPALLALKNPYDPVANAPYRVHDMTLYHGRYYLYFGVTPILILFWPVAALTGWYPAEGFAIALFCSLAIGIGIALLLDVRRRYFPAAPTWVLLAGALCLGFANPMSHLVQGPQFYQVAISAAIFLSMVMLAFLYRALGPTRHPVAWLLAGSIAYGLSVGSRPTYLLSGAALMVGACAVASRQRKAGGGASIVFRALAAVILPAAVCGAALLAYNRLRFDSWLEFGMRYQLAGETFLNLRPLDPANILPHIRFYLFTPGIWGSYFPFFGASGGQPYGFLRYLPWNWLLLATPLAFYRRGRAGVFAAAIAVGVAGNLVLLSAFFGTTDRYPGDFGCAWLLLSGLGALALGDRFFSAAITDAGEAKGSAVRLPYHILRGLVMAAAAVSVALGMAVYLNSEPQEGWLLGLARMGNEPGYLWQRLHHVDYGALRLQLEVPNLPGNIAQPIFESGRQVDQRDWLQLELLPGNRARTTFFHAGSGAFEGRPFAIPADRRLTITVRCGSLMPPFAHPLFRHWTRDEFDQAARDLQVKVDGIETLRAVVECYDASPADLSIGRLKWVSGGVARTFGGRVLAVDRLPLTHEPAAAALLSLPLPVELDLRLPSQRAEGADPILVTGHGITSDLLFAGYDGRNRIKFGLDHFGGGGPVSESVPFDPMRPHTLIVWMGSLSRDVGATAVSSGSSSSDKNRLVVIFDGRAMLNVEQVFYPGGPQTALLGINPYKATTAGPQFTGLVASVRQIPLSALPALQQSGRYGVVDMSVRFPLYVFGTQEPLVVTGVTGAGDLVYVRYLDPRHIQLGFDHWGIGGFTSAPIEVDYGQTHRLSITIGSLYAPGSQPLWAERVRVLLDGRPVLEGQSPCHPSTANQIAIATNRIGGSTCGPRFTGQLLSVERFLSPK